MIFTSCIIVSPYDYTLFLGIFEEFYKTIFEKLLSHQQ
jgi:hypothetical protein